MIRGAKENVEIADQQHIKHSDKPLLKESEKTVVFTKNCTLSTDLRVKNQIPLSEYMCSTLVGLLFKVLCGNLTKSISKKKKKDM